MVNFRIGLSGIFIFAIAAVVVGQTQQPSSGPIPTDVAERMAAERRQQESLERQRQAAGSKFLRLPAEGKTLSETNLETDNNGRFVRYSPRLNDNDVRAIAVPAEDLKKYRDFLRRSKTGAVRLQNAEICKPNDLIVQADGGCPNNVSGKATGFSFRTRDYRQAILADIFYKGGKLYAAGAYTIGIFSDLGITSLDDVDVTSSGIKELVDFKPPAEPEEVDRQYSIIKSGIQIREHKYFPEIEANVGNVYVLRSVAYKGKILKGEKPRQVNILADDQRRDVTIVFEITKKLSDGSIILIWKELKSIDPPKIVLEAKTKKEPEQKKFVGSIY